MRSATAGKAAAPPRSRLRTTRSPASKPPSRAGTTTSATDSARPRFHFIGGKGGAGKTTCAAAIAIGAAARGERVLVASTDPAPSLGDALTASLSSTPRRVPLARADLSAVEIDARSSLQRWLKARRQVLEDIAVHGTWLQRDEVSRLLRLSFPGIDELAALLEIARLARTRRYDLIVVDTAPTGHTLRMLAMPETLGDLAAVFNLMRDKRRVMEEALRGSWRRGAEDTLIDEIDDVARDLATLLRDPARTRITWVTLPEPMSVEESTDAVRALGASGIQVGAVIVNRMTPKAPSPCGHCDARRVFERRAVRALPRGAEVVKIGARDTEPRGIRALMSIAREVEEGDLDAGSLRRTGRWKAEVPGVPTCPEELVAASTRLLMFGGKGGVGKTTCAAAVALAAAQRWSDRRVLLVSTDPAHSLADALGAEVSDEPRALRTGPPNLRVREIDPAKVLSRIRQRYLSAVDEMFDRMSGRSFDVAHDRSVMKGLIELAPPGLDELAAVLDITDAITADPPDWDLVVVDTAPTGHALRLLEMPALMQDWARALMKILLDYQGVARLGQLGETLLNLSKGVGRLRRLLASRDQSRFVVVTRAAALPRLESARLFARLSELQVHAPALIVNAVGHGTCSRCRKMTVADRREIREIRRMLGPLRNQVILTAAEVPAPNGPAALRRWTRTAWRAVPGYDRSR